MLFEQVKKHGDNFSYVVADENTREAAVIDSGFNSKEIAHVLQNENLKLKYIIDTHDHIDHVIGDEELRLSLGGKVVVNRKSMTKGEVYVDEGEILYVGSIPMRVIYTPGHSTDRMSLLVNEKKLLTGDVLSVGAVGSTSMLGGDSRSMYDSLFNKLLKLPDEVEVYPGHDLGPKPFTTIGKERISNQALQPRNIEEFVKFMKHL
jgi:hydroxyacylglutathione hydrolase